MGQKIRLPKSNEQNRTPDISAMEFGELYVNFMNTSSQASFASQTSPPKAMCFSVRCIKD